ncbi:MAG: DUF4372 domain-containing protein [Bacteroidales bacterium]|nr:DUF4372 domain-containing protein [Bacteroidales bacterium]
MHTGKYVFYQVVEWVNKYEYEKCVKRHSDNYHVCALNYWNQ